MLEDPSRGVCQNVLWSVLGVRLVAWISAELRNLCWLYDISWLCPWANCGLLAPGVGAQDLWVVELWAVSAALYGGGAKE
jgi:hypothetical protein